MVTLSPLNFENQGFFIFLKEICDLYAQSFPIVEMGDLIAFFKHQVFDNCDILEKLTTEGFSAIQSFIMLINEKEFKI